jgi:nitrogen-specific signal transduction histidine kinase
MVADASLIGIAPTGFYERIRKFSLQRKLDPSLPELLHKEEVTVDDFLEFMSRADALKKK